MSRKKNKCIIVYTDGSCSNNGKSNAVGGIGIHFPNGELNDLSKVYRKGNCTNIRTELYAILTAIRYVKKKLGLDNICLLIKTDSDYSVDSLTKWVYDWVKNGWRKKDRSKVKNREFIELIHKYYEKYDIILEFVRGHSDGDDDDSIGNNIADELAKKATYRAISEQNKRYSGSKRSSIGTRKVFPKKINNSKYDSRLKSNNNKNYSKYYPKKRNSYHSRNDYSADEIEIELIKSRK